MLIANQQVSASQPEDNRVLRRDRVIPFVAALQRGQIEWADFVLMICTETYKSRFLGKAKPGTGRGVKWEGAIITLELYEAESHNPKFIPVVFSSGDNDHIPLMLSGVTSFDLSTKSGYESLYRLLTDQPLTRKPALGKPRPLPVREQKERFSAISDIQEDS